MENKLDQNEYISLTEASKVCSYSQEYLSLRARQGKLRAVKMGRNWVTTPQWLGQYCEQATEYNEQVQKIEITKAPQKIKEAELRPGITRITIKPTKQPSQPFKQPSQPVKQSIQTGEFIFGLISYGAKFSLGLIGSVFGIISKIISLPIDLTLAIVDRSTFRISESRFSYQIKEVTRQVDSQLVHFIGLIEDAILGAFILLSKGIYRLIVRAGRQLSRPQVALSTLLIILLIISSISLFSPKTRAFLTYLDNRTGQALFNGFEKTAVFVFEQSKNIVGLGQYINSRINSGIQNGLSNIEEIAYQAPQFVVQEVPDRIISGIQTGQLAISRLNSGLIEIPSRIIISYQAAAQKNEQAKLTLTMKISQTIQATPIIAETAFEFLADNLETAPGRINSALSDINHQLSDILTDTPQKLSDITRNLGQKLISNVKQASKNSLASLVAILNNLNQQMNQKWQQFTEFVPQIPQKSNLAWQITKDKLGNTYLRVVQLFEPLYFQDRGLVYRPKDEAVQDINDLEEVIIEDIQVRFDDFRGDWQIDTEQEEGVIVVPVEEDEQKTKQKIEDLSQAFSDEVEVQTDETGKAGMIEPIFGKGQVQKYLYMMVPVKDKKE